MRQALQTHQILRGYLNFYFSLKRAKSDRLPNHPRIALYALQEALPEELIFEIRFFGILNAIQLLGELEQRFGKKTSLPAP